MATYTHFAKQPDVLKHLTVKFLEMKPHKYM